MLEILENFKSPVDLVKVLSIKNIDPILENEEICKNLYSLIPDGIEKSKSGLRTVIGSTPFKQAVGNLSYGLNRGEMNTLVAQFGLDFTAGTSVENFLKAIAGQVEKEKQSRQKSNDDSNRMETE
ncbi:hypothetical protein H4219_003777 [Mycoemilia scoparia]|uniref:DEUBAD domain-containing protein n=1 Tax=Mycoemilia scoparia TaxID=417184 RepID=A0A9W8A395_9FUNG|nr:hypothetical protein H4219_003777 [Mycoemilia scoparia]